MATSLEKALKVLEALWKAPNGKGISIRDLAYQTGLPPSTVHRFLQGFKRYDLVEQDEASRDYRLGYKILLMGLKVRSGLDLTRAAQPILEQLSATTGEDAYLVIPRGDVGIFLQGVEGRQPIRVVETYGTEIPLHCGASRKAILAFKDDEWIEGYIRRGLTSLTEKSITDPEKLWEEIRQIRKQGYATSSGEYTQYAFGVAAPVRNFNNQVVASIGIIGLQMRYTEENLPLFINEVKRAGRAVSQRLGWDGDES
ncbi:MAG: IclR family transcriptional regulator [Clostridia bacterium]|nr:IclR family transcriptional regulator [Clostridia bacterium]